MSDQIKVLIEAINEVCSEFAQNHPSIVKLHRAAEAISHMEGWRPISEYRPDKRRSDVLTIDASGDCRVASYVPQVSSRTPAWWASVPGRWAVDPTHFMPIPPSPTGGKE